MCFSTARVTALGWAPPLPASFRLWWKVTVRRDKHSSLLRCVINCKKMIVLASSVNVIKTFSFAADEHAKIIYLTVFSNIPAYFAAASVTI